jgi:hypothetical protein
MNNFYIHQKNSLIKNIIILYEAARNNLQKYK